MRARFLGEALADVFGVGHHVAHHLQPCGLQRRRRARSRPPASRGRPAAAAPRFRRGALEHLGDAACRRTAGTPPARARAGPGNRLRSANQPSKPWPWAHWRLRTFMAAQDDALPVEFPCARQDVLQPQRAGQRLGVGTLPSRHQASNSAGVAVNTSRNSPSSSCALAQRQAAREPDVDELGRSRRSTGCSAPACAHSRARVAGFLQQLALARRPADPRRRRACRPGTRSSRCPIG